MIKTSERGKDEVTRFSVAIFVKSLLQSWSSLQFNLFRTPGIFRIATMRLGKKPTTSMLLKIRAPVAQMDQSGRFLNGKSRFDSGREHHFPLIFQSFPASQI